MKDKRFYVLATFDHATNDYFKDMKAAIRAAGYVGTETPGLRPHITMGSFEGIAEEEFLRLTKDAAAAIGSFTVSFNHIGIFSGSKVLFAAPDADGAMLGLRERLGPTFSWTPHVTLLIDEPPAVHAAAKIALSSFSPFTGIVESLQLYEFFPARHIATLRLRPVVDKSRTAGLV